MKNDFLLVFLTVVGTAFFGFMLYVISFQVIPEVNREIFIHAFGIVEGVIVTIFGYRFGSSVGSKEKTQAIINSTPNPQPTTPAL